MNATDLAAIGEGLAAGLIAGVLFQWVGSRMPRIDFWKPAAASRPLARGGRRG